MLFCSHNKLTSLPLLPNTLQKFSCSLNKLTSLPSLPNTLQKFNCDNNKLTSLPISLINCQQLEGISYFNNEIELTVQQLRFINRINNQQYTINNNIYNNSQNVHDSSIQQCLLNSINNLLTN